MKWPNDVPPLSDAQREITDDFVKHWHKIVPAKYGAIEQFNYRYPLRRLPEMQSWRTLELGSGIGGHLAFEPLERQDYHGIELRENMAEELRRRCPDITAATGDCEKRMPYDDGFF